MPLIALLGQGRAIEKVSLPAFGLKLWTYLLFYGYGGLQLGQWG
jgi:hypothetical protein